MPLPTLEQSFSGRNNSYEMLLRTPCIVLSNSKNTSLFKSFMHSLFSTSIFSLRRNLATKLTPVAGAPAWCWTEKRFVARCLFPLSARPCQEREPFEISRGFRFWGLRRVDCFMWARAPLHPCLVPSCNALTSDLIIIAGFYFQPQVRKETPRFVRKFGDDASVAVNLLARYEGFVSIISSRSLAFSPFPPSCLISALIDKRFRNALSTPLLCFGFKLMLFTRISVLLCILSGSNYFPPWSRHLAIASWRWIGVTYNEL